MEGTESPSIEDFAEAAFNSSHGQPGADFRRISLTLDGISVTNRGRTELRSETRRKAPESATDALTVSYASVPAGDCNGHLLAVSLRVPIALNSDLHFPEKITMAGRTARGARNVRAQLCVQIGELHSQLFAALSRDSTLKLSEVERRELAASLSHWLWSPESTPPFFGDHIRSAALSWIRAQHPDLLTPELELRPDCISKSGIKFPPHAKPTFAFIDLFAGIGGFRIAMQNSGGKCVFSSEWDTYAKKTYSHNFGEIPYGNIRDIIDPGTIPDHDILCAGFPCQPFSLAGVSKNESLGRKHGFDHATQGTLFFNIREILRAKQPRAFFLENVKNLKSHDSGRTFETIMRTLEDELKYVVNYEIVDGGNWVPQHRERIFIVGFDPKQTCVRTRNDIVICTKPTDNSCTVELRDIIQSHVDSKYTLGPGTWSTLKRHKANHAKAGNGFGYGLLERSLKSGTKTRTISARYHKDGAEILVEQEGPRPRRLTVTEAKQLQGYDRDRFEFPVSDTQAYRQIGNSVVVPAIEATARELVKTLKRRPRSRQP